MMTENWIDFEVEERFSETEYKIKSTEGRNLMKLNECLMNETELIASAFAASFFIL